MNKASKRKPQIKICRFSEKDIEPLYEIYSLLEKLIPYQPKTRFKQFSEDLTTSRMYPDKSHYDPKAEIAVVAEFDEKVVAFANGCKVVDAKGLVRTGDAYVRFLMSDQHHPMAARLAVRKVVKHLKRFKPNSIRAFNSYIAPVFLGFAGGMLPSGWGWLGHCLVQEGFKLQSTALRMFRDLKGRGNKPKRIPFPQDVEVVSRDRWWGNGMKGLVRKYTLRHFIKDVILCELLLWSIRQGIWLLVFVNFVGLRHARTQGQGIRSDVYENALISAYNAGAKGAILLRLATTSSRRISIAPRDIGPSILCVHSPMNRSEKQRRRTLE